MKSLNHKFLASLLGVFLLAATQAQATNGADVSRDTQTPEQEVLALFKLIQGGDQSLQPVRLGSVSVSDKPHRRDQYKILLSNVLFDAQATGAAGIGAR